MSWGRSGFGPKCLWAEVSDIPFKLLKYCLFPLSDQPTNIGATQQILLLQSFVDFLLFFLIFAFLLYLKLQNVYNNFAIKNIANERSFLSSIFIIVGRHPTYLPIGQIAESERRNKEYFINLGLFIQLHIAHVTPIIREIFILTLYYYLLFDDQEIVYPQICQWQFSKI
jgi:hypothetical protein